jgi:polar amino acid transport system substrate-binding protein
MQITSLRIKPLPPSQRLAVMRHMIGISLPGLGVAATLCAALPVQAENTRFNTLSLAICEDQDEWPPYSYFERKNGQKGSKVIGYAIDVIEAIFARHGIRYRIALIPWARCLAELKDGRNYQMALNLSYRNERASAYLLSRAYYSTNSYYYYSLKHHPAGLTVNSVADLKQFPVCGILGYNYTTYGFKGDDIDQSSKSFESLIAKLHLGRCALFIEKKEVMVGFGAIGKGYLADPALGRAPVPGVAPTPFHLGISRALPMAGELQALLDKEIGEMEATGQLQAYWKKAQGN